MNCSFHRSLGMARQCAIYGLALTHLPQTWEYLRNRPGPSMATSIDLHHRKRYPLDAM
jgi:hypothetical protein